jgi:hypothetical protein
MRSTNGADFGIIPSGGVHLWRMTGMSDKILTAAEWKKFAQDRKIKDRDLLNAMQALHTHESKDPDEW